MSRRAVLALAALSVACPSKRTSVPEPSPPPAGAADLELLREDEVVRGFRAESVYLDAAGARMGARFVHEATGFVFDYLRIESAPQGFLWVNSFPTTDQGEPHTQEHLILGKGNRGRAFANKEAMTLTDSSAFTMQWRTCYHFHTIAGPTVFWEVLENSLDALLNPDYTDEEIRREVRNFGVSADPAGQLRLEEKGTVYNEMVRSYEDPDRLIWRGVDHLLYGPTHPLARSSGGWPDDIRRMTPEDIRAFHRANYYLGNMGIIGSFPGSIELATVLDETGAILDRLAGRSGDAMTLADLPPPQAAAPGTVAIVDYPHVDPTKPSRVMLAWPATRDLPVADRMLLSLFVDAVAGDESTNLYRLLVDSKTRVIETGAADIGSSVATDPGQAVLLVIEGVVPTAATEAGLADLRRVVTDELARIARLPDGDPELAALAARVSSRVTALQRRLSKFLSSPPGFGIRGTYDAWMTHLLDLEQLSGFEKPLALGPQLAEIAALVDGDRNVWAERLEAWGLLETPYVVGGRPSPTLREQLDADRRARLAAELARLGKAYGLTDEAAILARFAKDYDATTRELEAAASAAPMPPFTDSPPMTHDDALAYEVIDVAGVPVVASTIASMTASTASLSFRVDAVEERDLVYLAMLPDLVTEVGLFEDGKAIPSEEVKEAQRREILGLRAGYGTNVRTGRVELTITAQGNDLDETRRGLAWMRRTLAGADWRVDNLPRIRDVVDQKLDDLRRTMGQAEESWVHEPVHAWWRQGSPVWLHTASFLTRIHDLHRLRWMLADPRDPAVTAEVARTLRAYATKGAKRDRAGLAKLANELAAAKVKPAAKPLLATASKDLLTLLAEIPEDSLTGDWAYLCRQMATDLERGADATLAALDRVRRAVLASGNARGWLVGAEASAKALHGDLEDVVAVLRPGTLARPRYGDRPVVTERLRERRRGAEPVFVGLVNPSTSSGVFYHTAPGAFFTDTSDDQVLDYLSSNLYTGRGGHSMFMKTWAAGLAYSNGLRISLPTGRILYYAERSPELPQTMRFVVGELEKATPAPGLAEYAIAQAFSSRIAASYESRARGIADDLADGVTPELVRAFRERVLAMRTRDGLGEELFRRMEAVYGKVLVGYGPKAKDVADGVFFVIGPDAQLDAWQEHLRTAEGPDATLYKLYPRDFWVPAADAR